MAHTRRGPPPAPAAKKRGNPRRTTRSGETDRGSGQGAASATNILVWIYLPQQTAEHRRWARVELRARRGAVPVADVLGQFAQLGIPGFQKRGRLRVWWCERGWASPG